MARFITTLESILDSEEGVTSIEYALLGALIAVVIFIAVAGTGANLAQLFDNVSLKVGNAISGAL